MYSLEVVKSFTHPDGRVFEAGHNCHQLNIFELAELMVGYPENFKPADEFTKGVTESNEDALKHYADAAKRQKEEK
jgi:hypothetical protein